MYWDRVGGGCSCQHCNLCWGSGPHTVNKSVCNKHTYISGRQDNLKSFQKPKDLNQHVQFKRPPPSTYVAIEKILNFHSERCPQLVMFFACHRLSDEREGLFMYYLAQILIFNSVTVSQFVLCQGIPYDRYCCKHIWLDKYNQLERLCNHMPIISQLFLTTTPSFKALTICGHMVDTCGQRKTIIAWQQGQLYQ